MKKPWLGLRAVLRCAHGAHLVEYILLAGLVALASMAGFRALGFGVRGKIDQEAGAVSGIPGGSGASSLSGP